MVGTVVGVRAEVDGKLGKELNTDLGRELGSEMCVRRLRARCRKVRAKESWD